MSVLIIPKRFAFSNLLSETQSLQKGYELKAFTWRWNAHLQEWSDWKTVTNKWNQCNQL